MIERLHIKGFRALRDVELSLAPLTVLVGPNASGKSSLLELLSPSLELTRNDRWRRELSPVQLEAISSGHHYGFPRPDQDPNWIRAQTFGLGSIQPLRLDLAALRRPNRLVSADFLSPDGDNLANVVGTLSRREQGELAEQFCRLVPSFKDVDLVPTEQVGTHTLRFHDRWRPDVTFRPADVSDGTLLLLAFLVLQFQRTVPDLITIDEAERGFHPYLLGQYVAYLRKLSRGELWKKPVQVVLATHSAELLDHVEPEEVRFFSRSDEDGSVRISEAPTRAEDWDAVRAEYSNSLGGIWLSGALGGVPG